VDLPADVAFIPLAPIRDPALVVPTVAFVLGVREAGDRSLADALVAALQGRRVLLVLDNLEQVLAAVPALAQLMAGCADLKVLATSRMVLRLYRERVFPVPSLALSAPDHPVLPDPAARLSASHATTVTSTRDSPAYGCVSTMQPAHAT
jgi:predicted ATPase